jgi:hypothetical protein
VNIEPFIDQTATNVLHRTMSSVNNFYYLARFNVDYLKNMYVMWQNKKSVLDLADDNQLPDHNKAQKLKMINYFKNAVLKNIYTDTTIFGMRKDENSPIVITDGIHRAIGIQKALLEDPSVRDKINLRILLFEGKDIASIPDYRLSIP